MENHIKVLDKAIREIRPFYKTDDQEVLKGIKGRLTSLIEGVSKIISKIETLYNSTTDINFGVLTGLKSTLDYFNFVVTSEINKKITIVTTNEDVEDQWSRVIGRTEPEQIVLEIPRSRSFEAGDSAPDSADESDGREEPELAVAPKQADAPYTRAVVSPDPSYASDDEDQPDAVPQQAQTSYGEISEEADLSCQEKPQTMVEIIRDRLKTCSPEELPNMNNMISKTTQLNASTKLEFMELISQRMRTPLTKSDLADVPKPAVVSRPINTPKPASVPQRDKRSYKELMREAGPSQYKEKFMQTYRLK